MNKQKFNVVKLRKTHYLLIINENQLKNQIIKETILLFMIIQRHHEKIIFKVVMMITYNIVLKML